jgi:beta-glucosidase
VHQPRVAVGEPVQVSVDVTNTGGRTADEVVQLYLHQRHGTAARPVRELKGFERLTLAPGEVRTAHFSLTPEDLGYWASSTRGFVQDTTRFDVYVGNSSTATLSGGSKSLSQGVGFGAFWLMRVLPRRLALLGYWPV